MANISIHGSHNASVAIERENNILTIIEIERILNYKNLGISQYKPAHTRDYLLPFVLDFVQKEFGISEFENCYYMDTNRYSTDLEYNCHESIPARNYIRGSHHLSHAAGTFYQSSYREAIVFSFDGGGNDGFFNVYHASRDSNIELIGKHDVDLGFPYMVFGAFLKDIKYEPDLLNGNLVYPGKLMGLCAFGKVIDGVLPLFKDYYHYTKTSIANGYYNCELNRIEDALGVKFDERNRLEGQIAFDIAATSQRAFEECFLELAQPYFDRYPHLPICITGGCALNIILNTRIRTEFGKDIFVAPNPSDCGLAMGMLANHIRPEGPIDITYGGVPILDKYTLLGYVEKYQADRLCIHRLSADLLQGSVVGIVRNNAEHGPRALGNRSIFCNPSIPDMKDILNYKIKNREWYRPFAPVCRLEDVNKYFDFEGESRFMTFCPQVRQEWIPRLKTIVHVDGSARVQTVTKDQNPWLYNLLTEFEKLSGIGILVNTSLNVDGKPIVSTYGEAIDIFNRSKMDGLVLGDYYFVKK